MARSSDIEFAKLALIFGFATKEKVYSAVREVAFLHELGINKRLLHILYERKSLTQEQIQALLWALFCSQRIAEYPTHMVYEFTLEDDQLFLERISSSDQSLPPPSMEEEEYQQHISQILEKPEQLSLQEFPKENLLECLEIQYKLYEKNFPRQLLSILSAKGYLGQDYRKLVPQLQEKKVVLSSAQSAHSTDFQRQCEFTLLAALASQNGVLSQQKAQEAWQVWQQVISLGFPLEFSEVLFYLNFLKKQRLNRICLFLEEVAKMTRPSYFIEDDLANRLQGEIQQDRKCWDVYGHCQKLAKQLHKLNLATLTPTKIFLHQVLMQNRTQKRQEVMEQPEFRPLQHDHFQKYLEFLSPARYPRLEGTHQHPQQESMREMYRKSIDRSMIPFSVLKLEKEFELGYVEERREYRRKPPQELEHILSEWKEKQPENVHEIPVSPSGDVSLRLKKKLLDIRQKPRKSPQARSSQSVIPDQTEYIPLDSLKSEKPFGKSPKETIRQAARELRNQEESYLSIHPPASPEIAATEYIAIDDSPQDIRSIIQKIRKREFRSMHLLVGVLIVTAIGIALALFQAKTFFFQSPTIPQISAAFSMFFLPGIFFSHLFGKLADNGKVHQLFLWGLFIHTLAVIVFYQLPHETAAHLVFRFIQGIGLLALFVAIKFCLSRWFGPAERSRISGLMLIFFTVSLAGGYLLANWLHQGNSLEGKQQRLVVLGSWTVISLVSIFWGFRLRVKPVRSEEDEIKKSSWRLPKRPIFTVYLGGLLSFGFIVVYFCFLVRELQEQNFPTHFLALFLGVLIGGYVLAKLGDHAGPIPLLRLLLGTSIFFFFPAPFLLNSPWAQPFFAGIGMLLGGLLPLSFSWLLEEVENEKYFGLTSASFSFFHSLGAVTGIICCSLVFQQMGVQVFFLFLTLFAIGFFYILLLTPLRDINITNEPRTLGGLLRIFEVAKANPLQDMFFEKKK